MHKLFYPERIAVIGVSEREVNMGRLIMKNLFEFGYTGEVFPVGRGGGTAFGRDILPSVTDLPPGIDVALVITPSVIIPEIVNKCGHKGIKWIVIESGGFGEFSESGKHLGSKVLQAAKKWGIRLVGPNGLGIINMANSLVTPFITMQGEALKKGKVAILSQSGGVLFGLINLLGSNNIGVSKVVSIGNKLDLDEIDYLTYLIDDKETEIIVMYLEGISNGRKLMDIAKRTTKPIIVQKANRYASSNQIARFHTEALATDDRVVDTAFKQAGIVRARTFREVVDFVKVLSIPPMKGNNLAIISRSGGIAISIADFASEYGFRLCSFSESFLRHVQDTSKGANVIKRTNPLDLGDVFDFGFYAEITEDIMNEKTDGVLFQLGTTSDMEVEASIALVETFDHLAGKYQKPISVYFLSDEQNTAHLKRVLDYPLFTDPAEAMLALAVSRDRYRRNREIEQDESFPLFSVDDTTISSILERARKEKRPLVLSEALEITRAAGIDTAPYAVCSDPDQAVEWADRFGYPLALKINVPSIVHKTDIQGIVLNIADHKALRQGLNALLERARENGFGKGIVVQKWISQGTEIILGGKVDETFGPVGVVGFGGIYAETYNDTSLGILPLTEKEADALIAGLIGYPVLTGIRGQARRDIPELRAAILRLSRLMIDFNEIKGIDINPFILMDEGKGGFAVDARILTG